MECASAVQLVRVMLSLQGGLQKGWPRGMRPFLVIPPCCPRCGQTCATYTTQLTCHPCSHVIRHPSSLQSHAHSWRFSCTLRRTSRVHRGSIFLPPRLPFSTHQLLNLVVGHQFWPPRAMIPIQASLGCLAFQVQLNSFGVVSELLDTVHCRDLHSIRE